MEDHNVRAGSDNFADLVVGGVCQHFAAAVALGVTVNRRSPEFPDFITAQDLLYTDRVDLN